MANILYNCENSTATSLCSVVSAGMRKLGRAAEKCDFPCTIINLKILIPKNTISVQISKQDKASAAFAKEFT